jgi:hypothetical protein
MKKRILTISFITVTCALLISMTPPDVVDYLSVGKHLNFNGEKYELKWSSHPSDNYYKQEYLKQGEEPGSHHNMILVEAIQGNLKIKDALTAKATELNTRKNWDAVANYKVYENEKKPNEGIIDFVVSDTMTTYEWNLYRYQLQGETMVLFAYSYRDSLNDNDDLKKFFGHIKDNRQDMINKLQSYSIPQVKITR